MSFIKIIKIGLVIGLFFLCIPSLDARRTSPLKLEISFDQEKYKMGDNIFINFKLKNVSSKPVYVNNRFFLNSEDSPKDQREVYLEVKSPSKEKLPCKISTGTGLPRTANFVLLQPQEETSVDERRRKNLKYYFDFTEPGTYEIVATYQNVRGEEIGVEAFKKKIVSEPVVIEIVE